MAIYHFSAKTVSRKAGQSAVAKAAYNARDKLTNEHTGEHHDYSRKDGILFSGIYLPEGAPEWAQDRGRLWSGAEAAERRKDATVAREYQAALPHELTTEQARRFVQDFVKKNFTRKGYAADVSIHAPDRQGDERNVHVHILVTDRRLTAEGFASSKLERQGKQKERVAELEALRESWERLGNHHLERYGHAPTLDRRSLEAQGIEREPGRHLGVTAAAMERKGIKTDRGDQLRAIEQRNRERAELEKELKDVNRQISTEKVAEKIVFAQPWEASADKSQPQKELGKTAGEIRLAWSLTRNAEAFAEALEERGLILVHVSAEESRASERARAFAKAVERENRTLKEGFAVVDQRGTVTRIDQRVTGDQREEIDKRLGRIDPASLLSVADAKEAMREANREAWVEKKQSERPLTKIEQDIAAAFAASKDGKGLIAGLDQAGIGIARVTGEDIRAIDALRREEQLTAAVDPSYKMRHFPTLETGETVAVNRFGDVHRLNPNRADARAIEKRLAEAQPNPASVVEVRAMFEIMRERKASFRDELGAAFAQQRTESAEARLSGWQARTADREIHRGGAGVKHETEKTVATAEKTVDKGAHALGGVLGGVAKTVGKVFEALGDMIAPPPPPTRDQAERMERAAEEKQEAQAFESAREEKEARLQELLAQMARDDAERRRQREERGGRDEDDPRERERDR